MLLHRVSLVAGHVSDIKHSGNPEFLSRQQHRHTAVLVKGLTTISVVDVKNLLMDPV